MRAAATQDGYKVLFMSRVRELDPARCLVVPVDIGKWSAMALVADHFGEVIAEAFEFPLTETGVAVLLVAIARAEAARHAQMCRVGVEATGHYHRTLVSRLGAAGLEVVQLNPAAVKEARSQQLMRTLKSDQRDLGAMVELMVRGGGRPVWRGAHRRLAAARGDQEARHGHREHGGEQYRRPRVAAAAYRAVEGEHTDLKVAWRPFLGLMPGLTGR